MKSRSGFGFSRGSGAAESPWLRCTNLPSRRRNSSRSSGSSPSSSREYMGRTRGSMSASTASPSAVRRSARCRRGSSSRTIHPLVSRRVAMSAVVEVSSATLSASVTWSMPGASCRARSTAYCTGVTWRPWVSWNTDTASWWARRIRWPGSACSDGVESGSVFTGDRQRWGAAHLTRRGQRPRSRARVVGNWRDSTIDRIARA